MSKEMTQKQFKVEVRDDLHNTISEEYFDEYDDAEDYSLEFRNAPILTVSKVTGTYVEMSPKRYVN